LAGACEGVPSLSSKSRQNKLFLGMYMSKRNRKRQNVLRDIFEIAASCPWWGSCIAAIVLYVVLHRLAALPLPVVGTELGKLVVVQIIRTVALFLQYVLPIVLLAGAVASIIGRRHRDGLINSVKNAPQQDSLRSMSWSNFELLVGEAFRRQGFAVTETGGAGPDEGIDLILRRENEVFLVQCKHWQALKVSVNIVRELFGVIAAKGATSGFVVTSGVFTADARQFAQGKNIELIDGTALRALVDGIELWELIAENVKSSQPVQMARPTSPSCPLCGGAMVKRSARRGANAGNTFWGCYRFPKCRGTRMLELQ
jgi:restriction system protein